MNGVMCRTCEFGYRLVDGRCMACISTEGGYVNCPSACYNDNPYIAIDLNLDNRGHLGNETVSIPGELTINYTSVEDKLKELGAKNLTVMQNLILTIILIICIFLF